VNLADVRQDYTIQKGTIVFPNVFSMHHDPRNYTEPDAFHPERFMSAKNDMTSHEIFTEGHNAFGFGRRICPARYLGAKVVFIGAVRMLWAFDFKPLTDANGEPMYVSPYESPFSTIK
jgi:cytochrome P450